MSEQIEGLRAKVKRLERRLVASSVIANVIDHLSKYDEIEEGSAPVHWNNSEATAWASGYNHFRDLVIEKFQEALKLIDVFRDEDFLCKILEGEWVLIRKLLKNVPGDTLPKKVEHLLKHYTPPK